MMVKTTKTRIKEMEFGLAERWTIKSVILSSLETLPLIYRSELEYEKG